MVTTPLLAATVLVLLCEYWDAVSYCFPLSDGRIILFEKPPLGWANGSSLVLRKERSLRGLFERSGFPFSSWAWGAAPLTGKD